MSFRNRDHAEQHALVPEVGGDVLPVTHTVVADPRVSSGPAGQNATVKSFVLPGGALRADKDLLVVHVFGDALVAMLQALELVVKLGAAEIRRTTIDLTTSFHLTYVLGRDTQGGVDAVRVSENARDNANELGSGIRPGIAINVDLSVDQTFAVRQESVGAASSVAIDTFLAVIQR